MKTTRSISASSSASVSVLSAPRRSPVRHRGFNFIEVLFAVILLGLGFIMIAGIFPVAIQQSTVAANETTGALVARDAIRAIQAIADASGPVINSQTANQLFTSTMVGAVPGVNPFTGTLATPGLLQALGNSCYSTSDRRFGWVGFYRRDTATDPYIQVIVVVLQNQNFADPSYPLYNIPPPVPSLANVASATPPTPATVYAPVSPPALPPTQLAAQFAYSTITGNSYAFIYNNSAGNPLVTNAVSGAFVLVAADPGNSNPAITPPAVPNNARAVGELTGRIFRLGNQIPSSLLPPGITDPNKTNELIFNLQPGFDLKDLGEETVAASSNSGAQELPIYIIGAAPNRTTGNFDGPNQDIAAVSAYVRLNLSN
jgi:type II secretory pathway pseudopilin PulG